jgi:DNA repair protein RadC
MKYLKKLDIKLVKGEYKSPIKGKLRFPDQIYKVFESLKDKAQETMLAVYMDKDLDIRVYEILTTGTSDSRIFSASDIFGHMFAIKAKSFILIHNHPQGDPTPSESDLEAVEGLKEQSKVMNVKLLDFIIVGDMDMNSKKKSYWSLFEEESGEDEYSLGICR